MNKYALILAGGTGTRLWPISKSNLPKQYLNIYNDNIMINETIKRIENLFDYDNIFVIISKSQEEIAKRYIDYNIPRENIIVEPLSKSTAMCIFYAATAIHKIKGEGVLTIFSSDHYIENKSMFENDINLAINVAEENKKIVILGIRPEYPSTQFGYIKCHINDKYNKVERFREKPCYDDAVKYFNDKDYYWNSGIFVSNIDVILESYSKYLPDMYKYINVLSQNANDYNELLDVYDKVEKISIDKGILEKCENVIMILGDFKWKDIGNINDFFSINNNKNKCVLQNCENINLYNENNDVLFAALGVKDLNIISCNNVLFVANKESMDELPLLMKKMQNDDNLKTYL